MAQILSPSNIRIADPVAIGVAGFALTEACLGIVLMEWRGVGIDDAFVANFFGVGGVGMILAAQWIILSGDTFAYTAISSYGLFYLGLGFLFTPVFGIAESYGGTEAPEYLNSIGLLLALWTAYNTILLVASFKVNLVFIVLFVADELGLALASAGYFLEADGNSGATTVKATSGAFCFIAAMLGFYYVFHLLCEDVLGFELPIGETSKYFTREIKKCEEEC